VGNLRGRSIRYALERWRANEVLVASGQQLSLAVDAAELGIFDWNVRSGRVMWSHHHARLFGLKPDQFGGTYEAAEQCLFEGDRPGLREVIAGALERHNKFRYDFRVVWPDGSEHWIEGRGRVYRDFKDMPARIMGTVMDITRRKAVEFAGKERELVLARFSKAKLTRREYELLDLLVGGMANKNIASRLNITPATVAKHRAHLMAKIDARNAADLARISTIAGINPAVKSA
jgi:PAS domain S-box-containing protein